MPPDYILRPAKSSDFDLIAGQRRVTLRESSESTFGPWNDDHERERFRARFKPGQISVVEVDRDPVGHLELVRERSQVRIRTIAILPAFCGRGIGTSVIGDLLASNPKVGLRVLKANKGAIRFYSRLGFQTVGESEEHWWTMEHLRY